MATITTALSFSFSSSVLSVYTHGPTKLEELPRLREVVQRDAHGAPVVTIVLPYDLLAVQLPQPGVVVRARGDEVRAVGRESTVPDPALVAC